MNESMSSRCEQRFHASSIIASGLLMMGAAGRVAAQDAALEAPPAALAAEDRKSVV